MSKSPISDERLLNHSGNDGESGWKCEALAVIQDIQSFVKEITVSSLLPCDQNGVYLNLEIKENDVFTIEMSSAGFRICGHKVDTNDTEGSDQTVYYETPYALLDSISPQYRQCFGKELAQKLDNWQKSQQMNFRQEDKEYKEYLQSDKESENKNKRVDIPKIAPPSMAPSRKPPKGKGGMGTIIIIAVLGVGAYFAYQQFGPKKTKK